MTLRTATYDDSTHVLLPKKASIEILERLAKENCSTTFATMCNYELIVSTASEYQEPENPLDMPLPCDIKIGAGTIKKGCKLSVLVHRMNVLYQMAMKTQLGITDKPEYKEPIKEMICSRCGSDRFKEPCKRQDINCPMTGTAYNKESE